MRQDFSNVTEQQLAALFPIILQPHDPAWAAAYEAEKENLYSMLGDKNIVRISHIGSSSVPGLLAKPTIDILLEIAEDVDIDRLSETMLDAGYVINHMPRDIILFLKGYTPRGFEGQATHIHVRHSGDWDELYFRDYLIVHPDAAAEYAALKSGLMDRYPNDRDGYTDAKGDFVKRYTALAQEEFPERYRPQ